MRSPRTIELDDGRSVFVSGAPPQGTRHQVLFGELLPDATPVVVKLERIAGTLETERRALVRLIEDGGPAPRLIWAGTASADGADPVRCIVCECAGGEAPTTRGGWTRMGRALARLGGVRWDGAGLDVVGADAFGAAHARRVADLGDRLAALERAVDDWHELVAPDVPGAPALVFTHGDPGPGNFLDDGREGTVIDWEEAHVAPRGLDPARAAMMALLGVGSAGFVGRDHDARARAVLDGYGDARPADRLTRAELRWWLVVAGVQVVHRRLEREGEPGVVPWADGLPPLRTALELFPAA